MTKNVVVLVVPCYNEAARLSPQAFEDACKRMVGLTLLFVDDGSTDATHRVLEDLATRCGPRVRVLRLERNGGKAEAVRAGVRWANQHLHSDFFGYWDADLATPLEALDDFTAVLENRPVTDLVIGSRVQLLGRNVERSALRHYVGRLFATAASLALDLPVYDTQCGAKLFRNSALTRGLFEDPFVARWTFDVEVIDRYTAVKGGVVLAQAGLYELALRRWEDVSGSKVKVWDLPKALFDLLRIRTKRRGVRAGSTEPATVKLASKSSS